MARRVTVLGAGSWGTALALQALRCGHETRLWTRSSAHLEELRSAGENGRYLPGHRLPPALALTDDLSQALAGSELVVCAIPSHGMRESMRRIAAVTEVGAAPPRYLIAAKGVEVDRLSTMAEVVAEELPVGHRRGIAVLGGPSFAAEVAAGKPCAVVVASADLELARVIQHDLSGERFRVYASDDVIGVELGGAFKNVIALAAGINDGAGLGENSRAALITRGLAEVTRLALARGARPPTLAGLAGLGDLVLTCTGGLSRNRRVGIALGEGRGIDEILASMGMVAEGVRNTASAHQLAQRERVDMPIVATMHEVLYRGRGVDWAVEALLGRALRSEAD